MNATANLGKAPVRTLVLQLAIPSMTAQFVNVLYSIIDRMYIGHISENGALALAGAGICGPIVTLLTSFGTLVGIGGSITMGIRMGEKNHKKAEQVLANSFLMRKGASFPLQYCHHCFKQNLYIQPKSPVADIFCIQSYYFFKICNITSATYLPHTCNPRFNGNSGSVMQLIFL